MRKDAHGNPVDSLKAELARIKEGTSNIQIKTRKGWKPVVKK